MKEYDIPLDRKYTIDHTWIKQDGNKIHIGITHYPIEVLGKIQNIHIWCTELERFFRGKITGIEMEDVEKYSPLGILTFSDSEGENIDSQRLTLISPCHGITKNVNLQVLEDPTLIPNDPYNQWIIELETYDSNPLDSLMSAREYLEHCQTLEDNTSCTSTIYKSASKT